MFDRQIFRLEGIRPVIAFCCAMSLALAALTVVQSISLATAIVAIWGGASFVSQGPSAAVFAACFIGRGILRYAQDATLERYAHRTVVRMRSRLLDAIFENGEPMVAKAGSAKMATGLVDGSEKIEGYLKDVLPKTVSMLVIPLVLAAAILACDMVSGIIVIICYPFIIAFMRLIGYTASDESAKRHEGFNEMSNHFLDSLRGMETLRSFGISNQYAKSVYAASERYRKLIMKTLRIAQLSGAVLYIFATCGLAAVAIMLGFRMVEGTLAFLPALIVLMLVPDYFMPIKAYASSYHASLDGKTSLESLLDMASIRRQKVTINGPGIVVGKGKTVALMGKSGVGKTTVLDVVAGVSELDSGNVSVCGQNSDVFREWVWKQRIAYIPQSPTVFAGTLRDNVALYAQEATDVEVMDALSSAGLADLVWQLPEGIHSKIGEGGRELSGGEAHRVSLARALVDPTRDIWLLDEPGSSMDIATEYALKQSMLPMMEGRTVVIATHRAHWIGDVDVVIDMEEAGEVVYG